MSYDHLDTETRVYLLYCDIGNYRHWIKESINIEKFFNNFDKLKITLEELTHIKYKYNSPTPNEELDDLVINEQKYIQQFLTRSWINTVSAASKLKTNNGKANKIKSFFDSLEPYKERFSEETVQLINTARDEQPDYNLRPISKSEKDKVFLIETEKKLSLLNVKPNNSSDDIIWFYQNSSILSRLFQSNIASDVIIDITKLMISDFDHKKASRFLRIKHKLSTEAATQMYVTACSIVNALRRIREIQKCGCDSYQIHTHSCPCLICQQHKNKIFKISTAIIGENFPPLCRHNCSSAAVYFEGITET